MRLEIENLRNKISRNMIFRNENSNKRLKEQPTSIVIPVHNVIDFDTFEFSYPKESAKISAKRLTIYEKLK